MLDSTPAAKAQAFLDRFEEALAKPDIAAVAALFEADGYWRDLVSFTWNIKTMEGRASIREMLATCLSVTKPRNWRVDEKQSVTDAEGVLELWFSFETEVARGYGMARVRNGLIWTLLTTMVELKGHEEKSGFTRPLGAKHGVGVGTKSWKETREEETAALGYSRQP
jgi:putative flavoprotein involved in K+ transport